MGSSVRVLDRAIALAGLIVLAPVLAALGLAVRLTSKGAALHRARRAGLGGRPFTLYKFRTMIDGASSMGPRVTVSGDTRITPLGRFLRTTKLDELPQLLNVVRGEMSLVGPRPEDPALIDLDDELTQRLYRYSPGITGAASLAFRREEEVLADRVGRGVDPDAAYQALAAEKMLIDLDYLEHRTLLSDLQLLVRTVARTAPAATTTRSDLDRAYRGYAGDYASRWSPENLGNQAILAERLEVARSLVGGGPGQVGRLLDIGGGSGGHLPTIVDSQLIVRLDLLEWRLREAGDHRDLAVCADGRTLPFPKGTFDLVILETVLSSISPQLGVEVIADARRALAPGGALLIYDVRMPNPANRATRSIRYRWLKAQLAGMSVTSRSVTVVPQLARRLGRRSLARYARLARLPVLRSHRIVVARDQRPRMRPIGPDQPPR